MAPMPTMKTNQTVKPVLTENAGATQSNLNPQPSPQPDAHAHSPSPQPTPQQPKRRKRTTKPLGLDRAELASRMPWFLPDALLAKLTGLSREYIRQLRRRYRLPESAFKYARQQTLARYIDGSLPRLIASGMRAEGAAFYQMFTEHQLTGKLEGLGYRLQQDGSLCRIPFQPLND